jgi:hypothetical protein
MKATLKQASDDPARDEALIVAIGKIDPFRYLDNGPLPTHLTLRFHPGGRQVAN